MRKPGRAARCHRRKRFEFLMRTENGRAHELCGASARSGRHSPRELASRRSSSATPNRHRHRDPRSFRRAARPPAQALLRMESAESMRDRMEIRSSCARRRARLGDTISCRRISTAHALAREPTRRAEGRLVASKVEETGAAYAAQFEGYHMAPAAPRPTCPTASSIGSPSLSGQDAVGWASAMPQP